MTEIIFEVDGRKVDLEGFADAIKGQLLGQISDQIKADMDGLQCDVHRKGPAVTITMNDESDVGFELSCCCNDFEKMAAPRLEDAVQRMSD